MADEQGISPRLRTWIARFDMLNAFAYQTGHAVILTTPLIETLSKAQTISIIDHELGHLKEGLRARVLRLLSPLIVAPIVRLRHGLSQ